MVTNDTQWWLLRATEIALVVYVAFYSARSDVWSYVGLVEDFMYKGHWCNRLFESTRLRHAPDTGESTGKDSIMGKGPIALPHRPDEDSQHQPESNEEEQQQQVL